MKIRDGLRTWIGEPWIRTEKDRRFFRIVLLIGAICGLVALIIS